MYKSPLYPEQVYHVYNRAHGSEKLFVNKLNYQFFLDKYFKYLGPVTDCISYCLMPNHFHLLVRIKELRNVQVELLPKLIESPSQDLLDAALIRQFSNFFNSYAKSFNRQQGRKGSLFMHSFRRKSVRDSEYLRKLIHYIHRNPIEAGLVNNPESWEFSSYRNVLFRGRNSKYRIDTEAVLDVFDNLEDFVAFHDQTSPFELLDNL